MRPLPLPIPPKSSKRFSGRPRRSSGVAVGADPVARLQDAAPLPRATGSGDLIPSEDPDADGEGEETTDAPRSRACEGRSPAGLLFALRPPGALLVEASAVGCPFRNGDAAALVIGGVGTAAPDLLASSDELAALDAFEF